MNHKKLSFSILVILLLMGGAGVFAFKPETGIGLSESLVTATGWEQVNSNGFGDPPGDEVSALAAFNGYLFAGTYNPIDPPPGPLYDGGQIFRSSDGASWAAVTQPGFGNTHDTAPPAILDLAVFKSYLYASTGRGNAAQIWRSSDGLNWGRVVNAGFGDPDIKNFNVMAEYNGWLYVGASKQDSEAQIWRTYSGDGNLSNWVQVAVGTDPAQITGMSAFSFDGQLYAAVQSEAGAPAQIWSSFGGLGWTAVITDGFGFSDTTLTGGMAEFDNDLYVGAGNTTDGAQLWSTSDGTSWQQVITPAFGNPDNDQVDAVFVFQNNLYVSTKNLVTGMEIWRSPDGVLWEQVNQDGFGDSNNSGSNGSNAAVNFSSQLYMGTSNTVDGGELWRMRQPNGVELSPNSTSAGLPGETVKYTLTITNSGNMADTFNLAVSGNSWPTTISTQAVALNPGASDQFNVMVSIPLNTPGNTIDTVTVTATSQADNAVKDSAILTTKCLDLPYKLYLPAIMRNP